MTPPLYDLIPRSWVVLFYDDGGSVQLRAIRARTYPGRVSFNASNIGTLRPHWMWQKEKWEKE